MSLYGDAWVIVEEVCLLVWVLSGAYERRSREGACNYRLHPGAIQIQIISQLTSKYGNHSFNQASE